MVLRLMLIRLAPPHRTDGKRRQIGRRALEVLPAAARVMEVKVHLAGEQDAEAEWDLCVAIRLASLQDPGPLGMDPIHRSFVDVFLKPVVEEIAVHHFEDFQPQIPITVR